MKSIPVSSSVNCLRWILGGLCAVFLACPVRAQSPTWVIEPFPQNDGWGGPQGAPAITNGAEITLQGQPVDSVQTYTLPVTISYSALLEARTAPDGVLWLSLIPPGEPGNSDLTTCFTFSIDYRNYSPDAILMNQCDQSGLVWGEVPFTVATGTWYNVVLGIAANGEMSLSINGQSYSIPSTVVMPYSQFQIQVRGWQPTDVWLVNNFTVTGGSTAAGSSCPNLIGTWSGSVNVADYVNGYSTLPLSLSISDENTNSCMFRGQLIGAATNNFTGEIADGTNLTFSVDTPGVATAVLNLTGASPVMSSFKFHESASTDTVITAVGTLVQVSTNAPSDGSTESNVVAGIVVGGSTTGSTADMQLLRRHGKK